MFYTMTAVAVLLIVLVLWVIITSNNLIAKRNRVKQCSSGICITLKQRNDLIPNLISAVKVYMGHEHEVLTRIAELRSQAEKAAREDEQIKLGGRLSSLLPKLALAVEAYPDLKASGNFRDLHVSMEEMEAQIQAIRRTYNAAVIDYNNYVEMFPSCLVARRQGHQTETLLEIPEAETVAVNAKDLFK
jgi:LemA protein